MKARIHMLPWILGSTVSCAALVGLFFVEGDDPLSSGFIGMGRIIFGFVALLMVGGLLTDGYTVKGKGSDGRP